MFLRHMPNLETARIHYSYLPDWTAYSLEPIHKLCSLCLVGRRTYVQLRFFNTLLHRCLRLETFEYCASQGMQGWELDRLLDMILRLEQTSRLLFPHCVVPCSSLRTGESAAANVRESTGAYGRTGPSRRVSYSMVER